MAVATPVCECCAPSKPRNEPQTQTSSAFPPVEWLRAVSAQCGLVVVRGVFCPSFRRNLYPMTTITSPATWDRSERRTATDSEDSVSRFTGSQTAGPAVAVGPAETGFERVSVSLEETLPG